MHIISRKKLLESGKLYGPKAATSLDSWFRIAKRARWKSLEDIRQTYPNADSVAVGRGDQKRVFTVFNIGGNDFRLITEIFYDDQTVLIRHVLTHSEYHKGNWKK
ncbi:MAG: type II toxin-antitoxin system HigB family toxin [Bryobacterales bacterium]|nr:type II toxin-antitoxin system HigB family toxin [Bryobacterales bacterium]MBV9398553.1 type II toxin-antitoxin system HigB family toxin [Bryobacterales bacterium]